ncbi:hypothetical protein DPMN_009337 [Dreissena polymorpha]|uniref:Uncharacterized protein n=1 Tax=Dreissena polymorpha TaxID=45954 RepID=A0A9D4S013_DREPO|nr:hypothetical protein DPMN_009337 [Dreissena polymorpha]
MTLHRGKGGRVRPRPSKNEEHTGMEISVYCRGRGRVVYLPTQGSGRVRGLGWKCRVPTYPWVWQGGMGRKVPTKDRLGGRGTVGYLPTQGRGRGKGRGMVVVYLPTQGRGRLGGMGWGTAAAGQKCRGMGRCMVVYVSTYLPRDWVGYGIGTYLPRGRCRVPTYPGVGVGYLPTQGRGVCKGGKFELLYFDGFFGHVMYDDATLPRPLGVVYMPVNLIWKKDYSVNVKRTICFY